MSDEWGLKLVEHASLPVRDGDGKAGFKERELTEVDSGLRQNGLLVRSYINLTELILAVVCKCLTVAVQVTTTHSLPSL
jgi:hypothetical protein